MTAPFRLVEHSAYNAAALVRDRPAPRLSVLVPFHRHDPSPLFEAFADLPPDAGIELIAFDDGSNVAGLAAGVIAAFDRLAIPAALIVSVLNLGRAGARNRLIAAAKGRHVLFLDADMAPGAPDFLARWLDVIDRLDPGVAFGGFSVEAASDAPEFALHKALSRHADCLPARRRAKRPAQALTTSNLLVRREVLAACPFDAAFSGWGYEDTEWALRAQRLTPIVHVDVPAVHLGLDPVATLVRKAEEGGANFARLAALHPQAAEGFSSFRMARALRRRLSPAARERLRRLTRAIAEDRLSLAPMALRRLAMKLLRAACAAEHLP